MQSILLKLFTFNFFNSIIIPDNYVSSIKSYYWVSYDPHKLYKSSSFQIYERFDAKHMWLRPFLILFYSDGNDLPWSFELKKNKKAEVNKF